MGKAADHVGQFRKTKGGLRQTVGVGLGRSSAGEGGADLRGKLRLRADCGLWLGLPQWEILPVSHNS